MLNDKRSGCERRENRQRKGSPKQFTDIGNRKERQKGHGIVGEKVGIAYIIIFPGKAVPCACRA